LGWLTARASKKGVPDSQKYLGPPRQTKANLCHHVWDKTVFRTPVARDVAVFRTFGEAKSLNDVPRWGKVVAKSFSARTPTPATPERENQTKKTSKKKHKNGGAGHRRTTPCALPCAPVVYTQDIILSFESVGAVVGPTESAV
jgi:hypothetical protein